MNIARIPVRTMAIVLMVNIAGVCMPTTADPSLNEPTSTPSRAASGIVVERRVPRRRFTPVHSVENLVPGSAAIPRRVAWASIRITVDRILPQTMVLSPLQMLLLPPPRRLPLPQPQLLAAANWSLIIRLDAVPPSWMLVRVAVIPARTMVIVLLENGAGVSIPTTVDPSLNVPTPTLSKEVGLVVERQRSMPARSAESHAPGSAAIPRRVARVSIRITVDRIILTNFDSIEV